MIFGTIDYLSPEQARAAPLDARSDIFSFGIVLYEALSGRRPFAGATSVMQYKKTSKKLTDIGRELGADAIIEGSVRRVGGRVRVTAQLIHAASDGHLWASNFDHDFSDVLKLQSEIADAIVREIKIQVTPDEARRLNSVTNCRCESI